MWYYHSIIYERKITMNNTFEKFDIGKLSLPKKEIEFDKLKWNPHSAFLGVELKHIITSAETNGAFSYHLVRIAPNCVIDTHSHSSQTETHEVIAGEGYCINEGCEIKYYPGIISIMEMGTEHKVIAGNDGLYLFAKFIPALC